YVAELLKALVPLQTSGTAGQSGFELVLYEHPKNPVPGLPGNSVERVFISAGKYSLAGQLALKRRCAKDRLDLFHSPFYPMPLGISWPVVLAFHDLIPCLVRGDTCPTLFLVKRGDRIAAPRASRITTVSDHTARAGTKILHVSPQKITATHNGVSHSDFHSKA